MPTMSDRPTDPSDRPPADPDPIAATDRPTATDQAPVAVPVEAAAAELGMSANAVRQRLKRGTLDGHKTAAGWLVVLPPTMRPTGDQPPINQPTRATNPRPTTATTAAPVDLAPLADLIERQGEEIRRLTEAATVWQVRAVQAEERLKQLTAGETSPQDAARTRQDAPGATKTPARSEEPTGVLRRLWGRLAGRE